MAALIFARSLLATNEPSDPLFLTLMHPPSAPTSPSSLLRLRPLASVVSNALRNLSPVSSTTVRGFATRRTTSSPNDSNSNWSNRSSQRRSCSTADFELWLIVVEKADSAHTRDEIIDSCVKTLSMVVGSEDEARMKLYSVSKLLCIWNFGAVVCEEYLYKLQDLEGVCWVLPDS